VNQSARALQCPGGCFSGTELLEVQNVEDTQSKPFEAACRSSKNGTSKEVTGQVDLRPASPSYCLSQICEGQAGSLGRIITGGAERRDRKLEQDHAANE
jgi:hypothetical protein